MQEDYLIRKLKDASRVLAIMLGLAKKGAFEEAILISQQSLITDFGLSEDFTIEDLEKQLALNTINIADLKQLLAIVIERGKLLGNYSQENAIKEFHLGLDIIELIEENTTSFDLSISQDKAKIIRFLNTLNPKK
jgi:hypothetical protein